ncbi:MAG: FKBP-type peptidyl-prolyl cis-trans isomerase [Elusimicrobia bacterium]|nr:FKBP-type peptidyl-prolyl cis-trans isomerase [Elusimicrobiota bacterium]
MLTNAGCEKKSLETKKDKTSYSLGWQIGGNLKEQGIDIDVDVMLRGFKDAVAGSQPLLTDSEMRNVMMSLQNELNEKQRKARNEAIEKNKKEGEEFLAKNKEKKGVKTTKSGLQYKIIKEGKGENPKADDTVTVHYRGTLIDGTEFDSSYKRNRPATFAVKGVIPGWTEALQMMRVGSKYELFIPSELAYGARGAGGSIGPNSTLIFTVELISIEKKKK